jgi:AcrR family transcriptional regulator
MAKTSAKAKDLPLAQSAAALPKEARRPRGRPRQTDVDERVYDATLTIFGRRGWNGFSIDAIVAEAKVGKTAIYLRWKDKMSLLLDAFSDYYSRNGSVNLAEIESEDIRTRLVVLVRARAHALLGPHGLAMARLQVESIADPETWSEYQERVVVGSVLRSRKWLQEAIDRGEVRGGGSAMQILEAIEGSVYVHALVTPPNLRKKVLEALNDWAERLVDTQLGLVKG